ncbi:RNA polymerase factor sigma-54 [Metabacillus sp. RGM 3146]|uniref:RNA polymerase factor sigma-54 n=1 Tax=Metabacillus sp. RGM 3146 TaxID=3401092 RepID=UPI003B9A3737
MDMKTGLFQEQTLKLNMTQQMMQAITLLQCSAMELTQYLQELTLENPLIEIKENDSVNELYHRSNKPQNSQTAPSIENISAQHPALSGHIRSQLISLTLTAEEKRILDELIDSLDENGYLTEDPEEIADRLRLHPVQVQDGLYQLQSLEPAGIGALSLQECLLLQLYRLPKRYFKIEEVIRDHFLLFAEKSWKELSRQTKLSFEEIQLIHDFIKKLNPRPGLAYKKDHARYITPDLLLEEKNGEFLIKYNDETYPEISVNLEYTPLLENKKSSEAGKFLLGKWNQFRWLQKALNQRKTTMISVMAEIVNKQFEFFKHGKAEYLKPMTLRDIAEVCDIHESTVSRAVKEKYVQTPSGLFEIRSFFSQGIEQAEEGNRSSASIKKLLSDLIQEENKRAPLSDQKLASILQETQRIEISRRTVAKYRDQLKIPASSLRKRYDGG